MSDPSDGPDELVVGYTGDVARDRTERWRKMFRSRLVSLGITVVILVVFTLLQQQRVPVALTVVIWVLALVAGLAWLGVTWWLYRRARNELAFLGADPAVRIGRHGVELAGRFLGWSEVTRLAAVSGPLALGPRLLLVGTDGTETRLPLDQIATAPATLDSAARAYSGNRRGVDLAELDA